MGHPSFPWESSWLCFVGNGSAIPELDRTARSKRADRNPDRTNKFVYSCENVF